MKYYLLKIDSFLNTFSIVETGKKVTFEYTSALNLETLADVNEDDVIIGYDTVSNSAKMLFKVCKIESGSKIVLIKELDVSQGGMPSNEVVEAMGNNDIYEITEEQYKRIHTEMLKDLIDSTQEEKKYLIHEDDETDYSIEELGTILANMYEDPSVASKTTAIHMFGIKYGKHIKAKDYSPAAIISASGISDNYQVELGKGLRIYESIRNDEFGIKFYENEDVKNMSELKTCLDIQES